MGFRAQRFTACGGYGIKQETIFLLWYFLSGVKNVPLDFLTIFYLNFVCGVCNKLFTRVYDSPDAAVQHLQALRAIFAIKFVQTGQPSTQQPSQDMQ